MTDITKRMGNIIITVLGIILLVLVISTVLYYLLGEKRPDLKLEEDLRNEYSVMIDVEIINTSEGYKAFLRPGKVKWDSGHKNLIYNLSDPKESILAVVEAISNGDDSALELMMTENSKGYWKRKGYDSVKILEEYRNNFKNINDPYIFSLEPGEDDMSQSMVSASVKYVYGEIHMELHKQPDGKWMI